MKNREKQRENRRLKQMGPMISNAINSHDESVAEYRRKLLNLKQDYQKALEDAEISLTSEKLKSLNTIDMVDFLSPYIEECISATSKVYSEDEFNKSTIVPSVFVSDSLRNKIATLADNGNFFHYIPCFEEGSIKINKKAWIYFKIKDLDITNRVLDVELQLYKREHLDGGFVLCLTNASRVCFRDNKPYIQSNRIESLGPTAIYTVLDDKTLESFGWNARDIDMWDKVVIKSRKETEEKNKQYVFSHSSVELATSAEQAETEVLFFYCIQSVNKLMELETLSKARKIKEPKTSKPSLPVSKDTSGQTFIIPSDKRKVRTLGSSNINIISERAPRTPNEQYVRHYSVSSWTQAGHIRHMKSGKAIYIKPQTKHRHALVDKNIEIPQKQTVIRVEEEKEHG